MRNLVFEIVYEIDMWIKERYESFEDFVIDNAYILIIASFFVGMAFGIIMEVLR